jgi:hypothetical protein
MNEYIIHPTKTVSEITIIGSNAIIDAIFLNKGIDFFYII